MATEIMCDIETMGLSKDAAIIAIGAVRFDPVTREVRHLQSDYTFYRTINLKSAQSAGGRIDADTVLWWLEQSEPARKALISLEADHIEVVLKEFASWVRAIPCSGFWGNGSDFDNVIIENAYNRLGKTPPWSYTANRCYRTLAALFPDVPRVRYGTHHNALDDAIAQALHLCEIFKVMK